MALTNYRDVVRFGGREILFDEPTNDTTYENGTEFSNANAGTVNIFNPTGSDITMEINDDGVTRTIFAGFGLSIEYKTDIEKVALTSLTGDKVQIQITY